MRVKVEVYQPKDGGMSIPVEYVNMREYEIRRTVDDMVMFGISRITTNYTTLGLSSWSDVRYRPLAENPPEALANARNKILRSDADRLALFGIMDLTIEPSDADMQTIRAQWLKLSGGAPDGKPKIPLNIELDPLPMQSPEPLQVVDPPEPAVKDTEPVGEPPKLSIQHAAD
jgi:hypothetical protein